jgi:hypothetical protein
VGNLFMYRLNKVHDNTVPCGIEYSLHRVSGTLHRVCL